MPWSFPSARSATGDIVWTTSPMASCASTARTQPLRRPATRSTPIWRSGRSATGPGAGARAAGMTEGMGIGNLQTCVDHPGGLARTQERFPRRGPPKDGMGTDRCPVCSSPARTQAETLLTAGGSLPGSGSGDALESSQPGSTSPRARAAGVTTPGGRPRDA
jgi:hypothetical protein